MFIQCKQAECLEDKKKPVNGRNVVVQVIFTEHVIAVSMEPVTSHYQGWGQVQLVKYSNTSSTRSQVQVQVQVLCIFANQVLKYIKY